jgi:hypothetical protein
MLQNNNEATSQPVAQATKTDGASKNVSVDSLAAMLMRGESPAEEKKQEAATQTPQKDEELTDTAQTEQLETTTPEEVVSDKTEADSKEEDSKEEVLSHDKGLPPELQEKLDKRIGKEVAKRKILEENMEALRAEIETLKNASTEEVQLPPSAITTLPNGPLANINDFDGLRSEHNTAKEIMRLVEDALDMEGVENGFVYDGQTYTKQQLKQIRRNAERTLNDYIPQRAQFLQQRDEYTNKAVETFPWAKDKTSKEYKQAVALMRQDPRLGSSVDGLYSAGVYLKGLQAIEAEKTAKPRTIAKAPSSQLASPVASTKARITDDEGEQKRRDVDVATFKASKRNLNGNDVVTMLLKKSR